MFQNAKRRRIGFGAIVAVILLVAAVLVYGNLKSAEDKFYFENSTFVSGVDYGTVGLPARERRSRGFAQAGRGRRDRRQRCLETAFVPHHRV
jgi:hypothetical protein